MKKTVFPIVGLVGLAAFLLQWEYLLTTCEVLVLAGFVWLLFGKRVPLRTVPLLVMSLALGVLIFSQPAMSKIFRDFFPHTMPVWLPDAPSQPEPSWIVSQLIFRPFNWFYRLADALTGLCLVAILLPWFKHLVEKWQELTSMVIAGLFLVSFILWPFGIEWSTVIGFLSAVYCITLMATDLFSVKKNKSFYIVFLSVLAFSLLATLVVAIIYHQRHYYGDIYVVVEWLVTLTAPLCSSLFYMVYPLCKKLRSNSQ